MTTEYFDPRSLSVVFLCYDEPKRQEFFEHLQTQVDHAIKVEGIKGIDTAHKAAAAAATTERFILIDGDALVDDKFWNVSVRIPDRYLKFGAWSFTARNIVNDTTYGPGGVKVFTREFINGMQTHENANSPETQFEFCWQDDYAHFSSVWSTTYINQSPFQAWRSGFRECTKLMFPKCDTSKRFEDLAYYTQRKLVQWMTLGTDVENGNYTVHGAHCALGLISGGIVPPDVVNDYDRMAELFDTYEKQVRLREEATVWPSYQLARDVAKRVHPLPANHSQMVKEFIRTRRENPLSFFTPCFESTE